MNNLCEFNTSNLWSLASRSRSNAIVSSCRSKSLRTVPRHLNCRRLWRKVESSVWTILRSGLSVVSERLRTSSMGSTDAFQEYDGGGGVNDCGMIISTSPPLASCGEHVLCLSCWKTLALADTGVGRPLPHNAFCACVGFKYFLD